MKRRRRQGGFTLVEVLLVLAILVILGSLVTVGIMQAQKTANMRAAKSQISMLEDAVEMYQINVGRLPEQLEDLRVQPGNLANPDKWQPVIEKEIPVDPWQNQYQYSPLDNGDRFEIKSFGPDGSEGGNDDITNLAS